MPDISNWEAIAAARFNPRLVKLLGRYERAGQSCALSLEEIADQVGASQSTIANQLRSMRREGLLTERRPRLAA